LRPRDQQALHRRGALRGHRARRHAVQPPALWGYNRELKDYEYSPSQAQALLREAGQVPGLSDITWEDGKKEPLVFWYMSRSRPYFPNPKEIAEAMAADLAKVGITTQL